jgi:hypothetical protein
MSCVDAEFEGLREVSEAARAVKGTFRNLLATRNYPQRSACDDGTRPWLELLLIEQWKAKQPWRDTRGISTGGHGGKLGGELGPTASPQRGFRLERLGRRRRRAPEPTQEPLP